MDKRSPGLPVSVLRGIRLALHLFYAVLLAIFYPRLNQMKRRCILKAWSRQLLGILNIGIRTEGEWSVRGEAEILEPPMSRLSDRYAKHFLKTSEHFLKMQSDEPCLNE